MKSLLALLLLGIALGIGFWKTQYPEATLNDLSSTAGGGLSKIKSSVASLTDGGASADAITGRLDTIEAELVETQRAADPSVVNGRLTDAERRMDASETQIDQLDLSIDEQSTAISALTTGPGAVAAQVSAIDNRLNLLNRRIDEQSQQFDADSINSSLSELSSDISQLQESQKRATDEQSATLAGMGDKLNSFEARLNTLSSDAGNGQTEAVASVNAQIDQRMALLENKLGTTTSDSLRIESMTNELSASRVKMNALESSVTASTQQIAEMNRTIESLKTQSESTSIDDQQSKLRVQLANLQNQINQGGGNADIAELTDSLQATRERIQTLEQRVVDLPASSTEATDATQAQSALEAQIRALESKLANFEANPKLANSITEVEEKVSALAAKGYVTQEELRSQQQAKSTEYKIYFERNSTAITEAAGNVLNSFIAQEKNRTTGVSIYGFTDRRGSAVYNQQLALQRATNVRSYLIQNGFSYTKIKSLSGLGEDAAAADIADGEEDAQQRAVVLYAQQP